MPKVLLTVPPLCWEVIAGGWLRVSPVIYRLPVRLQLWPHPPTEDDRGPDRDCRHQERKNLSSHLLRSLCDVCCLTG